MQGRTISTCNSTISICDYPVQEEHTDGILVSNYKSLKKYFSNKLEQNIIDRYHSDFYMKQK